MNYDYRYKTEGELRRIKDDAQRFTFHHDPRVRWRFDDQVRDVNDELRRRRQEEEDRLQEEAEARRKAHRDEERRRAEAERREMERMEEEGENVDEE